MTAKKNSMTCSIEIILLNHVVVYNFNQTRDLVIMDYLKETSIKGTWKIWDHQSKTSKLTDEEDRVLMFLSTLMQN